MHIQPSLSLNSSKENDTDVESASVKLVGKLYLEVLSSSMDREKSSQFPHDVNPARCT